MQEYLERVTNCWILLNCEVGTDLSSDEGQV